MSHLNGKKQKLSNVSQSNTIRHFDTMDSKNYQNSMNKNLTKTRLDDQSYSNLKHSVDNFSEKLTNLDLTLNYLLNEISKNNDTKNVLIDYLNPILK